MKTIGAGRRAFSYWLIAGMVLLLFALQSRAGEWSEWKQVKGWKGLDFRLRMEAYNSTSFKYSWFVQFRNRYQSKIHFGFHLGTVSDSYPSLVDRLDINSGKVGEYWGLYPTDSAQQMKVWVGKVRLNEKDTGSYAAEDDGH